MRVRDFSNVLSKSIGEKGAKRSKAMVRVQNRYSGRHRIRFLKGRWAAAVGRGVTDEKTHTEPKTTQRCLCRAWTNGRSSTALPGPPA